MEERPGYSNFTTSGDGSCTQDEVGVVELWQQLDQIHQSINGFARRHPSQYLSSSRIAAVNSALEAAKQLLERHNYGDGLDGLPVSETTTFADALILIGGYKAALRSFRINVLGESPYGF